MYVMGIDVNNDNQFTANEYVKFTRYDLLYYNPNSPKFSNKKNFRYYFNYDVSDTNGEMSRTDICLVCEDES